MWHFDKELKFSLAHFPLMNKESLSYSEELLEMRLTEGPSKTGFDHLLHDLEWHGPLVVSRAMQSEVCLKLFKKLDQMVEMVGQGQLENSIIHYLMHFLVLFDGSRLCPGLCNLFRLHFRQSWDSTYCGLIPQHHCLLLLLSFSLLSHEFAKLLLFSSLIRCIHGTSELRLAIELEPTLSILLDLQDNLILSPFASKTLISHITSILSPLIFLIPSNPPTAEIRCVSTHIALGFHVVTDHLSW